MHPRAFLATITFVLLVSIVEASGQVQHNLSAPARDPDYTLRANARIVLTDITVTDRDGKPVLGLKSSDFQVFDDKTPQTLSSFEEHTTQPVSSIFDSPTAPGVYNNEFVQQLPPFLNIMLIDIKNIEIEDQLYLNYKLTQFIDLTCR
jgi:VWFA-related protein